MKQKYHLSPLATDQYTVEIATKSEEEVVEGIRCLDIVSQESVCVQNNAHIMITSFTKGINFLQTSFF